MKADVTIVGAGPTGLCLAHALASAGMRVVVIERQNECAIKNPSFDGREIALTHESKRLMQNWGLWQHLPPEEISSLRHALILDGSGHAGMSVRAELGNQSQLGWLVSNHLIRQAAYQQAISHPNVALLYDAHIEHVATNSHHAHVVLKEGQSISSQLLVAADSRFSETRRVLGIPAFVRDYAKSMMVCRVKHSRAHDHVAWEWFGYGQTRALLPLNNSTASVVLTLPHHQMHSLLALEDNAFDQDIAQRYEHRLGTMERISERYVYPLVGVYASRFHDHRVALVGDAAVGMHPVTAHGFNLGILSVHHLAERLINAHQNQQTIYAPSLLRSYTQAHRKSSLPLFAATNAVIALYTNDTPPARVARQALLKASDLFTPFKRFVATQLTG